MANNLRLMVDFNTFDNTCKTVDTLIGSFNTQMGVLKHEIEDTKNSVWDSNSGTQFRLKYDNCNGEVMDCINYLRDSFLKDLRDAAGAYKQLEVERNQNEVVNKIEPKDIF